MVRTVIDRSRVWLIAAVATLCAVMLIPGAAAAEEIEFTWAFVRRTNEGREVIDFDSRPVIRSGDELQIHLRLDHPAFVYLYFFDTSRRLTRLSPIGPTLSESGPSSESVVLPAPLRWFTMDETPGIERFTLLVSGDRLTELEAVTDRLEASPSDGELKAAVLAELRRAIQEASDFAAATERGVAIAGAVNARRADDEINGLATRVTTDEFYGRMLRLVHRARD